MNSKDQEYNPDIDLDENELNDDEELFALGIEFEEEEFSSLVFDSLDGEDGTDNDLRGTSFPRKGMQLHHAAPNTLNSALFLGAPQ